MNHKERKSPVPGVPLHANRVPATGGSLVLGWEERLCVAQVFQLLQLRRGEDPRRLDTTLVSGKGLVEISGLSACISILENTEFRNEVELIIPLTIAKNLEKKEKTTVNGSVILKRFYKSLSKTS